VGVIQAPLNGIGNLERVFRIRVDEKKVGAVVVKRFVGRSDTPVMAAMV